MAAAVSNPPRPNKSTIVRSQKLSLRAARAGFRVLTPAAPRLAAYWAERLFMTARRHERPSWERDALAQATAGRVPYAGSHLPIWTWHPAVDGRTPSRAKPHASAANTNDLEDRPTVILVHGWEGRGSQLSAFVSQLTARGFRVVAFDAPGHGDAPLSRASVVEHARALMAVADHLGPETIHAVIGHSVGGAATLLATRFGLSAKRFALVAPPKSPAEWANGFARMLKLDPSVKEAMIARIEDRYALPFATIDSIIDAARLEKPLLVVHDREDKVVPFDEGAAIAKRAPRGSLVETTGFGHNAILRAPRVVDAVTRFVTEDVDVPAPEARAEPTFEETLDGELFMRDTRW